MRNELPSYKATTKRRILFLLKCANGTHLFADQRRMRAFRNDLEYVTSIFGTACFGDKRKLLTDFGTRVDIAMVAALSSGKAKK